MKKTMLLFLMASIIFTAGCENATESTANTVVSFSETEEIVTDIIDTIPDIQYDYNIYDRFSEIEIRNMNFSQKGIFSYTTNYDLAHQEALVLGDTFKIECKLTNMTNQTIKIAAITPVKLYLKEKNPTNPVATYDVYDESEFNPYETKSFFLECEVTDDTDILNNYYSFYSNIAFEITQPCLFPGDGSPFFTVWTGYLPVSVKNEE